ncbi:rod shape-determining protein MreD [Aliiroseovarius sp. S1339]|uniref:rod shape-determining protein MreD n=1 Tax=Aliiroseovarius sp. S1339 TaxID=2936990 RepID=UPI0020BE36FA|nr:rod shape-determining protein MreD [Aliiroseovarius sp. S1339]MCK8464189.1 rod shape-determining protein MreD [Aliiroseovarius sp. S1339]
MTDRLTLMRWLFSIALVAIAAVVLFARLLPIDLTPGRIPGPDILLAFTFAWVLRRPDYVPVLLVAILFFLMDMLLLRVPGVWPLMIVAGSEFLRRREHGMREQHFLVEWGLVAMTLLAMLIGQRLLLAVFFVDQVPFGLALMQIISTAAVYPMIVFISVFLLGVEKLQPGDDVIARQAS